MDISNKDSTPFGRLRQQCSSCSLLGGTDRPRPLLNLGTRQFQPSKNLPNDNQSLFHHRQPQNNAVQHPIIGQVNPSSPMHMMEKIQSLERSYSDLCAEFKDLKTVYNLLYTDIESMKTGNWAAESRPFQDRCQVCTEKADNLHRKPDQLKVETVKASLGADTDIQKNGKDTKSVGSRTVIPIPSNISIPGHLRNTSCTISLPPHLRCKQQAERSNGSSPGKESPRPKQTDGPIQSQRRIAVAKGVLGSSGASNGSYTSNDTNSPLITHGNADLSSYSYHYTTAIRPTSELTSPPSSPTLTIQPDTPVHSIEDPYHVTSSKGWKPLYIQQLEPLHETIASFIPPITEMITFSADFLRNTFGGATWSPGFNYVEKKGGPCILPNRSYYTVDHRFEPYLPKQAGEHGAKLTPFFNENPEEFEEFKEGTTSFENVPMFVITPGTAARNRYVYFGNYSQTRWSDKLDYERMVEHVPRVVKEYWAEELSAVGRPEWITTKLMKHFWPKPVYDGRLFGSHAEGSVAVGEEEEEEEEEEGEGEGGGGESKMDRGVERDVKTYIRELKEWKKEATLKTKLIKKGYILDAFETADADEPKGLRLWWEYLQCVNWNRELYTLLVQLQSRNPTYL